MIVISFFFFLLEYITWWQLYIVARQWKKNFAGIEKKFMCGLTVDRFRVIRTGKFRKATDCLWKRWMKITNIPCRNFLIGTVLEQQVYQHFENVRNQYCNKVPRPPALSFEYWSNVSARIEMTLNFSRSMAISLWDRMWNNHK